MPIAGNRRRAALTAQSFPGSWTRRLAPCPSLPFFSATCCAGATAAAGPQIVVATKVDALDDPKRLETIKKRDKKDKKPFFAISSVTNVGVKELVAAAAKALDELAIENTEFAESPT